MTRTIPSYDPISSAAGGLLLPGLGQWVQGRRAAAIYFFADAVGLALVGALVPELRVMAWAAAAAVNLWSVVDAAVVARRLGVADV